MKDEMESRISMALKDPILQQGFEIICKNLAKLEGECDDLCDSLETQGLKVAELEKENAELKADNDARKFAMAMSEKVEKQLREQIEKMKCCFNCKHSRTEYEHCRTDKHEKWEIKEND